MYALVEIKGKQYKAEKNAVITVDRVDEEAGASLELDKVLLVSDDGKVSVGQPYVKGAKVTAEVLAFGKFNEKGEKVEDVNYFRDKKIIVYKYKSKKDYHRTIGHRQHYSQLKIKDIIA